MRRFQRGYVLITLAVASVCVCGFAGLAVDVGFVYHRRAQAQTAADAAALAAAAEIPNGGDYASAGQRAAKVNGFANGVGGATVAINRPVLSGTLAGSSSAVEVIVSQASSLLFMRILSQDSMMIRARSVAKPGDGGACIYALNPNAPSALRVTGSATISVGCGILVNSAAATAISIAGNACVTADSIGSVGGASVRSSCPTSPPPVTGLDHFEDPLRAVPAPAVGGCNFTDFDAPPGPFTLSPGVYCGGMKLNNTSAASLQPGVYVLLGGGLRVVGGASVNGSGVLFYNTFDVSHPYAPLLLTSGSVVNLSAPASGPYGGVLFFEDRNAPTGQTHLLNGGSTTRFEGSVYLSRNELKYSGGAMSVSAYTILVADTLEFIGNSHFETDYSTVSGGSPVKSVPKLAE